MSLAQFLVLAMLIRARGKVALSAAQARSANHLAGLGYAQNCGRGSYAGTKAGEEFYNRTIAELGFGSSETITAREARVLATARLRSMGESPWFESNDATLPGLVLRRLLEVEPDPLFKSAPRHRITVAGLEALEAFERRKADTVSPA